MGAAKVKNAIQARGNPAAIYFKIKVQMNKPRR